MCQKCGSYLRAALINVITVYIRVSIVFHKVFDEFHRIFQFFRKKSVQGTFDFINELRIVRIFHEEIILRKKELVEEDIIIFIEKTEKIVFLKFLLFVIFL